MNIREIDLKTIGIAESIADLADSKDWDRVSTNNLGQMVHIARELVERAFSPNGKSLIPPEVLDYARKRNTEVGLVILRNLPRPPDPRKTFLLLGEVMGDIVRYEDEGDYIIEVKEDPKSRTARPGFNNSREFFPHTDLSYVDYPPQFFCLHSLVNEKAQGGFSEFVDIQELISLMSPTAVAQLQEAHFLFPAPAHYRGGGVVQRAILEPTPSRGHYLIRFRRDGLRSPTRQGINAIIELCRAIQERMTEIFLEPNSVAVINNRRILHGRTAFLGGTPDSSPRHINRLYFEVK